MNPAAMDQIGSVADDVLDVPPTTRRRRSSAASSRHRRSPRGSPRGSPRSSVTGGGEHVEYDLGSRAQASHAPSQAQYTLSGPHQSEFQTAISRLDKAHIAQLREQGFSTGLACALASNAEAFHHRIWVVDNSGSMAIGDGHRIVETADRKIMAQPVTRWEEIQDTVLYHSQMAALLNSPTVFTLLNDPGVRVGRQKFAVAQPGQNAETEIRVARNIMQKAQPQGVTPLTSHILEIQDAVRQLAPRLKRSGQRVAIILATDGLPTDEQGYGGDDITAEFVRALRSLEGLPIWLVIRLCTDEDKVTDFYNNLDEELELSLEVLDDFLGEAREVHRHNKWLNYALPMHRCRELGYHDRLFDLIDEKPLTKGELRNMCTLLFGTELDIIPDPHVDWKGFLQYVQDQLKVEQSHWNPITKKVQPWINVKMLHRVYGKGGKCTIM